MADPIFNVSLAAFIGVAVAHLLAAISPGPSFVLSVRTAANEGFRTAAGLAFGFGLGATIWAAGALLGLKLIFEILPWLFTAIKIAGGLFLCFIAWGMWRHATDPLPPITPGHAPQSTPRAIRLGLAAMLANPKPAIFFGGVFVGLVPRDANAADLGLILFNILWIETLWYVMTASLFSRAAARKVYARWKTACDRTFGAMLAALGLGVAAT